MKAVFVVILIASGLLYKILIDAPNKTFGLYCGGLLVFGLGLLIYHTFYAAHRVALTPEGLKIGNTKTEFIVPYSNLAEVIESHRGRSYGNRRKLDPIRQLPKKMTWVIALSRFTVITVGCSVIV